MLPPTASSLQSFSRKIGDVCTTQSITQTQAVSAELLRYIQQQQVMIQELHARLKNESTPLRRDDAHLCAPSRTAIAVQEKAHLRTILDYHRDVMPKLEQQAYWQDTTIVRLLAQLKEQGECFSDRAFFTPLHRDDDSTSTPPLTASSLQSFSRKIQDTRITRSVTETHAVIVELLRYIQQQQVVIQEIYARLKNGIISTGSAAFFTPLRRDNEHCAPSQVSTAVARA